MQNPSGFICRFGQIHQRAGTVSIQLFKANFFRVLTAWTKSVSCGSGLGSCTSFFFEIWNVRFETFHQFATRPFDKRGILITILAIDDNSQPSWYLSRMTRNMPTASRSCFGASASTSIGLSLSLAKNVLNRIEVMLAHVAQTASIIIPVPAERLVDPMRMVWLKRCRPEPEVIIQSRRDWLWY